MADDGIAAPEAPDPVEITLKDVLGGLDPAVFFHDYWQKGRVYTCAIQPDVLDELERGFFDGDLEALMASCRRQDNTPYAPEDCSEDGGGSLETLASRGATVNLAFCFAPSALALREALVGNTRSCRKQ